VVFEIGSLICTTAPTSKVFILGHAIAGVGASGLFQGVFIIIDRTVPLRQRALVGGCAAALEAAASVSGPVLGGVLTDRLSWRACFGINLPLGVIAFVLLVLFFPEPQPILEDVSLPWKEKVCRLDLPSTAIFVPSVTCLLMALQWGGFTYGWIDPRVIVLFALFGVSLAAFGYLQHRLQDGAILPPRILKQRSILAGAWFAGLCNATLAVTDYYIVIYLQAVQGLSATRSGLLLLPLIIGLGIGCLAAGALTTALGYYLPFMLLTSIVAPIASGLLTTITVDYKMLGLLWYLGLLGVGVGIGIQGPQVAAQTVLSPKDVSTSIALVCFGQGIGPTVFVAAANAIFTSRLQVELNDYAPGTNPTLIEDYGLAEIRNVIGAERLKGVLLGFDQAVVQTMYLPVALTCLTLLGSIAMERRSVKNKQT